MQQRTLFRAVFEEYAADPLPSRSAKGRFHDEDSGRTAYLAGKRITAWKEVIHRWMARPKSYRTAEVSVKVSKVVDLTDPGVQAKYGIDVLTLTGEDHEPCRRLARRIREEGAEAIWTFSRADQPGGRQLVVFLDRLASGSSVRVRQVGPIEEE